MKAVSLLLFTVCAGSAPDAEVRRSMGELNRAVARLLKLQRAHPRRRALRKRVQRELKDRPTALVIKANRRGRAGAHPLSLAAFCRQYVADVGVPLLATKPLDSLGVLSTLDVDSFGVLQSELLRDVAARR